VGLVLTLCVSVALGLERGVQVAVRRAAHRSAARGDRGDVPGWVLVTLMTAGLVTVLWVVAKDRLTAVFEKAIDSVKGP
jgi:hypothetical protein